MNRIARQAGTALLVQLALVVSTAHGQSSLSLVDVLPPYLLSARLLANGHFAISTRYSGEPKTLVYREDGSGGRPVNYTSHVHFRVDDVIFQLPFELDPVRREPPPEHPLTITELFRDTTDGRPRVNARMFGVMPDGDTMRFVLTMLPVERPSGGFIRLQTEVHNTSARARSVGVLMLVDTKIGDNDRAPIVSAFGYRTKETEHRRNVSPGMPEFWLALEGTPLAPGLTARGNLRASGLIEPDLFLAGNWKDNTAVPGAVGLGSVQWKERSAFDVEYTDSAVLLVWDEQTMAPGEKRLRAATEIGIVDSLTVRQSEPGFDLVFGGSGIGGSEGCLAFDTLQDRTCATPSPHPYHPDPLNALYLVTNVGTSTQGALRLDIGALPPGLDADSRSTDFLPSALDPGVTGVAVLAFRAIPRLWDRTYSVPVRLVADGIPVLEDSVCVFVPGLIGAIKASNVAAGPLCPGTIDTLEVPLQLSGPRCLPLAPQVRLEGPPSEVARFQILDPVPDRIPAMGTATVRIGHTAGPHGTTSMVRLVASVTEMGLNDEDRDTMLVVADTAVLAVESRNGELQFADRGDTLDFGAICVGDTVTRSWPAANIGGCDLVIREDYRFEGDVMRQFSMTDPADFPMIVRRDADERLSMRFAPTTQGIAEALLIITTDAAPYVDTLVLRGRGDVPATTVGAPMAPDTICVGDLFEATIPLTNPTGCPVEIVSVTADDATFSLQGADGLVLPAHSTRRVIASARFAQPGRYETTVRVTPQGLEPQMATVGVVVVRRELAAESSIDFGEVRVGLATTRIIAIRSSGTASTTITRVRLTGANASEYSVSFPDGRSLPRSVAPGDSLPVEIRLQPVDLEQRIATLVVETASGGACGDAPIVALSGRGILPLLDAPHRRFAFDRLCVGRAIDTTLTLRNRGNADLEIKAIGVEGSTGSLDVEISDIPPSIPPDGRRDVRIRLTPRALGPFESVLRVESNGVWLTAPDTLVSIAATGVLCGTVWTDTLRVQVGEQVVVPVRFDAPPLTPAEISRLLMPPYDSISVTVRHRPDLLMATSSVPSAGWIKGSIAAAPGTARVEGMNGMSGEGGEVVTGIPMEVLLGSSDRTPLGLTVDKLAGGYSDLSVRDGLLIAEYCAIDKRYVTGEGMWLASAVMPLRSGDEIIAHLSAASLAEVSLHDALGRTVATLADGELPAGSTRLQIPALAAGTYTAVLRAPQGSTSMRVVVVR